MARFRHGIAGFWLTAALAAFAAAAEPGILIAPDEDTPDSFSFTDDFDTPRFLREAALDNVDIDCWSDGAVTTSGPNRNRTLTYRFYGERVIQTVEITVEQRANGPNWGGRNTLYVSRNGLDWELAANSSDQEGDAAGWQSAPLTVPDSLAQAVTGGTELWVRLVLDNYSGLKTIVSNSIDNLSVKLDLGPAGAAGPGAQAQMRAAWARARQATAWHALTLDWADPPDMRPPYYIEGADGWLYAPGQGPMPAQDDGGFPIARRYANETRYAFALAAFVATHESAEPAMAKITIRSTRDSHRVLRVLWDGAPIGEFDAARFYERDQDFYVAIPGPHTAGVHELRIAGMDADRDALIRRIELAGPAVSAWAGKPPMPAGGPLRLLAAYYMPDPAPPAASQAVEGRQPTAGLNLTALQRLYDEHAEFGALRVAYRNDGPVPLRLADTVELNGRPVEDSYVDFVASEWDAPGVVWYRAAPRTLEPAQCGEVYIRFRRRPAGDAADVTLRVVNGDDVSVAIPYTDPGVTLDYVTAAPGASGQLDRLYVYARRSAGDAGELAGIALDGKALAGARICGAGFPGNVALGVATLPEPLRPGDYHVAGIVLSDGRHVAARFRVVPFLFPRSSIHVPPDMAQSMHMNLLTWVMRSPDICEQVGLPTSCMHSDVLRMHERVAFIFAPDEPDAKDNRGGGYANGLGWHARALETSGWAELVARHPARAPSWMNMDGTTRPLNWAVYGQFG
ncbi:MAG: hypothetical protein JXR94_15000, partial [Candidatus Hydrogenedentes bacterium]|nr:hypothetical protein [Candidatus Hydrogenedentota bacterium]